MKLTHYAAAIALTLYAVTAVAENGATKTFASLKALDGTWEGKNSQGEALKITFRETAGGSALLSEIEGMAGHDMVSMIHLDGDRLLLTHYCGAGNQPRMQATLSPDGKSVVFDFVDATNLVSTESGHMHRVVFSIDDAAHHTEEWTFLDHGKERKETFTLQRRK